jgi:hypothetical protein
MKAAWLFGLGAAWNLLIGLSIIFAPAISLNLLYGHQPSADDPLLMMLDRDFAFCVLLFGVGYAIVARDPSRNHGLIWLGIIGKLGVVATLGQRWLTGVATAWVLPAAAGDLVFAALFAWFLWRSNRTPS